MKENYIVYKHIFPNNKIYIGITSLNVKERWGKNGKGYNKQTKIKNAIKKYGWENVKHEVLFDKLTKEEAENKEICNVNAKILNKDFWLGLEDVYKSLLDKLQELKGSE